MAGIMAGLSATELTVRGGLNCRVPIRPDSLFEPWRRCPAGHERAQR
jgi:hypothetical protein